MSDQMTVDPLRIAADRVIRRIIEIIQKSKGQKYDENSLVVWIGNELAAGLAKHDELHDINDPSEYPVSTVIIEAEETGDDYSVSGGYVINDSEQRLNDGADSNSVPKQRPKRAKLDDSSINIIEKIFGYGVTIEEVVEEGEDVDYENLFDSPASRVADIAVTLGIDVEEIANFIAEDPDDYFELGPWLESRNVDPAAIERAVIIALRTKLMSAARRKPKRK
jgi:hypothetical protein